MKWPDDDGFIMRAIIKPVLLIFNYDRKPNGCINTFPVVAFETEAILKRRERE